MAKQNRLVPRSQVAALPVRQGADGRWKVLLVTSRETQRWIVPKGWPIKGVPDYIAAAQEAREEAGLFGYVQKKPLGCYEAWKRLDSGFELVNVRVFRFDVEDQFDTWLEKGQRQLRWVDLDAAADLIEEPGLSALLRQIKPNWEDAA
ncbi:NUDIX hydrolase [Blastochloris viridis]|uniref:NUDIX domain protein n=2 Tax=Blastochloris viridis TaxID=1079 RepID=A0A0P0JBD6_BLAVI|nr:NUDIX domain-containing protein [Blastochloris viridis]ALK09280.1 NUDIX domain protein [Blastochloris viridis]CUU41943.1 NUDIX domain protein [Blastochloris viridis]